MATVRYPIVGMFYRPPAQALVDNLPAGTSLYIVAEPDNHADPNAIAVYLPLTQLDSLPENIDDFLQMSGNTREDLKSDGFDIQLGYIPKHMAAKFKSLGFHNQAKVFGIFGFGSDGGPRIIFDAEPYDLARNGLTV